MMSNDRGFQPIKRPLPDEDSLLEALAAKKGVGRMQSLPGPLESVVEPQPGVAKHSSAHKLPVADLSKDGAPALMGVAALSTDRSRARMRAMNLELPDYVMVQLKQQAIQDNCSVRHIIMRCLSAQGITIQDADMISDGRRNRGKRRG